MFSAVGEALADALSVFSLDVVGVVADYVVWGVATAESTPSHLFSFGSEGTDYGKFTGGCYSLAFSSDGNIWVGDGRGCQMFSSEGKFVRRTAGGNFTASCWGIAFDSNGEVFLADTGGHRILVCRLDSSFVRSFVRSFGSERNGEVQFMWPRGLAVDGNGQLFAADSGNHRVQVLRRDGSFVRAFGSFGSGDGQLRRPYGIAFSAAAEVFISDSDNHRVEVIRLFLLRVRHCVAGVRRQRKVPTQVRQRSLRTRTVPPSHQHRIGRCWQCFRVRSTACANFQIRRHVHHHVRLTRPRCWTV